ncbi:hypothetical protein ACHAWO_001782 [Cyclotella atomus]|uniref:Uncharacterized protein n=1 Tax=Cyclotella atomus TaxID=382360 RepID=A0ABD3P215_9STRA
MGGGEGSLRISWTSGHDGRPRNVSKIRMLILFSLGPTSRQLRFYALEEYPLLWAAMDDVWCNYLPDGLRLCIINSLAEDAEHLQVHPNVNPVKKVTVLVAKVDGVPEFTEVDPEFDNGIGGGGGGGGSPVMMEWRNFVIAKICGMENRIHELQSNQGGHHGEL